MGEPIISFVAERYALHVPAGNIDRDKGLVKNVRIVGENSPSWKRRYPLAVLEKHRELYAASVAIGHHFDPHTKLPTDVPPTEKFGRMLSPRVSEDRAGITGDLKYNPEHPFAKPFLWAAENDPAQFSFSPIKKVQWLPQRDSDGFLVAESILQVLSVDVVSDGGTTSTIYESHNVLPLHSWAAEMAAPDAQKIADSLESDGAWLAFLTDLFAKMGKLSQTTKDAIQGLVAGAMSAAAAPADNAAPADQQVAMNSLRHFGPVGAWAAKRLDALFVAEAAKKRDEWAAGLIKAEQVAEALVTPLFVSMVAESFGNEARAKEIIADRKKLAAPTGRNVITSDRDGSKSVADLTAGYVAG